MEEQSTIQSTIQKRLDSYIKSHGIKASFICDKLDICPSLLCRFRKGQRVLWDETLKKIEDYLVQQGY